MNIRCPKCRMEMEEEIIEDIEITEMGIYLDANEIYKCTKCGYVEDPYRGK